MRRKGSAALTALLALGLLACGGSKRPPAVSEGPPPPPPDESSLGGPTSPTDPVDWGPDIQPVDSDLALGEELLSGPDGEGGPLADVYFEYDRATLSPQAQSTLEHHARWLLRYTRAQVVVEGHCDERGTVEYNLALGDQRARAALEYLLALGVPSERMTAVSYGKERPLDPASNESAWSKNRRAHFVVSR